VSRAFGEHIGFINGYICVVDDLVDNALYIVLFGEYIAGIWNLSNATLWIINISAVVFITVLFILQTIAELIDLTDFLLYSWQIFEV